MASSNTTAPVNPNYIVTITQDNQTVKNSDGTLRGPTIVQGYLPESFSFDVRSDWDAPFAQGIGGGLVSTIAASLGIRLATQAMTAKLWKGGQSNTLSLQMHFYAESNTQQDVRDNIVALMKLVTPSVNDWGLLTSPGPQFSIKTIQAAGGQLVNSGLINAVQGITKTSGVPGSNFLANQLQQISNSFSGITTNSNVGMVDTSSKTVTSTSNSSQQSSTTNTNTPQSQINIVKAAVQNKVNIKIGNYAFFDCVVITNVEKVYESQLDTNGLPVHATVNIQFEPMFTLVQSDLDQIFL